MTTAPRVRISERALGEARDRLMRVTSRIVLFVFLPIIGLSTAQNWSVRPALHAEYLGILGSVALLVALTWRPVARLLVAQALLFIALFLAAFAMAVHGNGPQPASVTAACVVVAWATLFFGWRGLVAVIAALLLVLSFLAWHLVGGVAPASDLPVTSVGYWLRAIPLILANGTVIGLIVLAAMRAYAQTLRAEREALAAAAHEENARLAAEAERDVLQRRHLVAALASGLAHDLNNVIQVTGANAEMLRETVTTADDRESADQILAAAERARRMVRELLALGRPAELHAGASGFDGAGVIRRLELMLRSAMPRHVRAEFAADEGCVLAGDELRFEQVIINLALNARDAMPAGGTLAITLRAVDDSLCCLGVRDSGVGIPPEIREKVFAPFFTTKPAGEGSGIGLSTVARAVADVGGRISVESSPGQGTLFTVFWPRQSGERPSAP